MIPSEEETLIKQAMEAAKKTPEGMDFPVLGPEKKFPINLYCNDSLEPSTSANNRSVYTRWIRNGTGLVNLYCSGIISLDSSNQINFGLSESSSRTFSACPFT